MRIAPQMQWSDIKPEPVEIAVKKEWITAEEFEQIVSHPFRGGF